jgi:hypothetical protein
MRTRTKIDNFRRIVQRNIGTQFHIRGDEIKKNFKTGKKAVVKNNLEIPTYILQPNYNLSSREWIHLLHSTVHAAVYRSIRDSLKINMLSKNYDPKKEPLDNLPSIQIFKSAIPTSKSSDFNQPFKHNLKMYEEATVHGKKRNTFAESYLNKVESRSATKLFDVTLTKKELVDVVNEIKKELKEINSPFSFNDLLVSSFYDPGSPQQREKIKTFYKLTKLKTARLTQETTPSYIGEYIFYLKIAQIMTNKLVRKTIEYVKKNS